MREIHIDYIETGDILFLEGDTWLANQIKKSQKDKGNKYWYLNHVGQVLIQGKIKCVAEEDYPGRFDINDLQTEYIEPKKRIYLGRVIDHQLSDEGKLKEKYECIHEASEDRFTDYGYIDILSFKLNSWLYKRTGKDIWIGRKKNKKGRFTCSQRTAKFLQDYYGILKDKSYLEYTPADIADSPFIEIYKIIY